MPDLFSEILIKALLDNDITPLKYATFVELQNDSTYLKYTTNPLLIIKRDEYRILKTTLVNKKQINASRIAIGMNLIEDDIKKIVYQRDNKHQFYFEIDNGYIDLSSQQKHIKKLFKSKSIKLDFKKL